LKKTILKQVISLVKKDILLEWRLQHTFFGILLYTAGTIFILYLAINDPQGPIWNGLFWITLLFMCVQTVAKSFLQENRNRLMYYQTIVSPIQFLFAKLIYNTMLMIVMSLLTLILFSFFMGASYTHFLQFFWITLAGGISLTLLFTLLSAITARANQHAAMMAVLGFPLMVPQLLLLLKMSKTAFGEVFQQNVFWEMNLLLFALDGLIVILSFILFPFLWKE
jgi:heme exporter protein B